MSDDMIALARRAGECAMTPLLPHVREPAGEPDVCAYCCEEWMDVDPTEACPLRAMPWTIHADVAELVALVAALESAP